MEDKKQLAVWLPAQFMDDLKSFVKSLNDQSDNVQKIALKRVVYTALKKYMEGEK